MDYFTEKKASDFLWKIVLTGDSYVGKTTIRKRAMGEHFAEEYISTVGADFSSYKLKLGNLSIGFQIWDLAGQDKYKYIRSSFYGGATGCFLVYDVTNPISLKDLSGWVDEAIRYSNGTIEIFIICANKIDLKTQRQVSRETGEKYALALKESSGLQCEYIETSALTGESIDIAFDLMARCLLEREGIHPTKVKEEIVEIPPPPKHKENRPPVPIPAQIKPSLPPPKKLDEMPKQAVKEYPEFPRQTRKSIIVDDRSDDETERLISEVLSVLDDTKNVIIGKEQTATGEHLITVPLETIQKVNKEEKPKISVGLEKVLQQINLKLDSLTTRLKGLEEEITSVKLNGKKSEKEVSVHELKTALPFLEPIREENLEQEDHPEEAIEERETFESVLITRSVDFEEEKKLSEGIEETIPPYLPEPPSNDSPGKEDSSQMDLLEKLMDIKNNDLTEIPQEEPLETIQEERKSDPGKEKVIGTELSGAMISELKTISEKEVSPKEVRSPPPSYSDPSQSKNKCPICGEELKFIRQYYKYYCVKCGRYLI